MAESSRRWLAMRIFVSYPSERRSIGERLAMALRTEGHDVFLDTSSLPPGQTYDSKIRQAIERCDLFVFLISPESVEPGAYTLSELEVMARRAQVPGNRVLGVMVAAVPLDQVPNYLRALNILHPVGEPIADVLARVGDIAGARRAAHRRLVLTSALVLLVLGAAAGGFMFLWGSGPSTRTGVKAPGVHVLAQGLSVFQAPDQNSEIIDQVRPGEEVTLSPSPDNPNWMPIRTRRTQGWAMAQDVVLHAADPDAIKLGQGYGFQGSFWKLFFTSPQPGGKPPNKFGIDARFADAVSRTQQSLDIATYELNSRLITDAIIDVHRRGRAVRVVTDRHSLERSDQTFRDLTIAGIRVFARSGAGLMHNKFAIIDRQMVWTGSWNPTDGATYANNENALVLQGADIGERYQVLFDRMFNGLSGRRRPAVRAPAPLSHGVVVLFAPEDPILPELLKRIGDAKVSVIFLTFVFTVDELAQALHGAARHGVVVRGIFERNLARNASSVINSLCRPGSKVELRLDSNPRYLHHDAFVIDGEIVITGSLNVSRAGLMANDENVVIIPDGMLARKFESEFARLWATATAPEPSMCADR